MLRQPDGGSGGHIPVILHLQGVPVILRMDGAPRAIFAQVEELRSLGLTVPDTVDLLDRLRRDGLDLPLDALTVDECADAVAAALR